MAHGSSTTKAQAGTGGQAAKVAAAPSGQPVASPSAPSSQAAKSPSAPSAQAAKSPAGPSGPRTTVQVAPSGGGHDFGTVRKSVFFLAAVVVAFVVYLVASGQMQQFLEALGGVNVAWIWAALACWALYYVLGVSAYAIGVAGDPSYAVGVRDLMSVEATGIFFSHLTPNGTGGAPAQIFRLTRAGLSAGQAGALQYTRFIIYEAAEGIFAAIMLLFRGEWFLKTYGDVWLAGALLFGSKVMEVAGLLLVCLLPRQVMKLGNWALDLCERRGWFERQRDGWREVLNHEVIAFSEGFRRAAADLGSMLVILCVTLVQLGCQYALPWFALKAFGKPADLVTCLACGSMLELLTSAVPLPGGTGGAEGGFAFLFGPLFGDATAAGFVVWRAVEYFIPILVSIPLMGLRSSHRSTINARMRRLSARLRRAGKGGRAGRGGTAAPEARLVMGKGDRGDDRRG